MSEHEESLFRSFQFSADPWKGRLLRANTVEDVLWVVKDFLATWIPSELQQLPANCLPGRMRDSDDVTLYAFRLINAQFESDQVAPEVDRMAAFFAAASTRLSQVVASAANDMSRASASN